MPGSRAVHQNPQVTDQDSTDVLPGVRYVGGDPENISIDRSAIGYQLLTATPTILSAQVLVLNGTPQPIVFGTLGKIIIPERITIAMTGATINYATNTTVIIGSQSTLSSTTYTMSGSLPLLVALNTVLFPVIAPTSAIVTSIVSGDDLYMGIKTGNPTAGDGDIVVKVYYWSVDA